MTGREISARAEIPPGEQAAFLRSILEASTEYSIIATDLAGKILAWNEGARRLYGYAPADVLQKADLFLLHDPEDVRSGMARSMLDHAHLQGKWAGEIRRVRKDGSRFNAGVTITLRHGPDGEPAGFAVISRDLGEGGEENRRRLAEQFFANMSHELRTPLNGIIGFAELMHDGKVGAVAPTHKEYLGDILTSARHLLQLITDVLDLAKVEAGKMEFQPEQNPDQTGAGGRVARRAGRRGGERGRADLSGEKILVVDDNPTNLKLVRVLLTAEGYEVQTALDAAEALAAIASFAPRLILMDIQLPGMDGLALTRGLKTDPATRRTIIVAVTAYAMKGDDARAMAAGCDGYIAKPIDTRTLPETIARYLQAGP
jgi:PAS domain S-box-containing protein